MIPPFINTVKKFMEENFKCNIKSVFFAAAFDHSNFLIEYFNKELNAFTIDNKSNLGNLIKTHASFSKSSVEITQDIGSIIDKKYQTDIIVNTTGKDLQLENGNVSKIILKEAGQKIQYELNANYPNGLDYNKTLVAVSSAGKMQNSKFIFHISLPDWKHDSKQKNEKNFKSILTEILKEADVKSCNSILLPAIGTGALGYPKDLVPEWMYTTIDDYCRKNANSTSLEKITIVLYDKDTDTINEFRKFENFYNNNESSDEIEDQDDRLSDNVNDESDDDFFSQVTGVGDKGGYTMYFKNVQVHVYVGDITKSTDDVIVSPTDSSLRLNGAVSQALLKAGGQIIKTSLKDTKMNKNGICFGNPGRLNAKEILHIDIKYDEINQSIINTLYHIDEKGYKSVTYPVIGTGAVGIDPKAAVKEILKGFTTFIDTMTSKNQTPSVNKLNICIYEKQQGIINLFYDEMENLSQKKSFKNESRWSKVKKGLLKMFKTNTHSPTSNTSNEKTLNSNNNNFHTTKIVKFKLISDEKQRIEKTKKALQTLIDEDTKHEQIRNEFIAQLNRNEIRQIESCLKGRCEFKIEPSFSRITITGPSEEIHDCIPEIYNLIDKFRSSHINKAQNTAQCVHWQYQDGMKWKSYNLFINEQIEAAHSKQNKRFDFRDECDDECFIDFGRLAQCYKSTDKIKHKVKRVDLAEIQGLPTSWEANKTCDLVVLDPRSKEYTTVKDLFCPSTQNNNWVNNIIKIERVQNKRLYKQYMEHKEYFEQKNNKNANERTLFHGTTDDSVENIWKTGFNRSYAGKNATVYGKGVYFARDSAYSHGYTSLSGVGSNNNQNSGLVGKMFLCKVLVGNSGVGNSQTETKNLPKVSGIVVDTTVDNLQNPSIFVIYHDAQAYPEYLITYQ